MAFVVVLSGGVKRSGRIVCCRTDKLELIAGVVQKEIQSCPITAASAADPICDRVTRAGFSPRPTRSSRMNCGRLPALSQSNEDGIFFLLILESNDIALSNAFEIAHVSRRPLEIFCMCLTWCSSPRLRKPVSRKGSERRRGAFLLRSLTTTISQRPMIQRRV